MKLPFHENAYVPISKIREYLLAKNHPQGGSKAHLLRALGHDEQTIDILIQNLLDIAYSEQVTNIRHTPRGMLYKIDGALQTPSRIVVRFRTVWFLETDGDRPRFVTAYPIALKEQHDS
jgi:hypothetical protein